MQSICPSTITASSFSLVAWSPDGKLIAALEPNPQMQTIHLFDTSTNLSVYSFSGNAAQINAVVWSPDGTRIASGGLDNTVLVWQAI